MKDYIIRLFNRYILPILDTLFSIAIRPSLRRELDDVLSSIEMDWTRRFMTERLYSIESMASSPRLIDLHSSLLQLHPTAVYTVIETQSSGFLGVLLDVSSIRPGYTLDTTFYSSLSPDSPSLPIAKYTYRGEDKGPSIYSEEFFCPYGGKIEVSLSHGESCMVNYCSYCRK